MFALFNVCCEIIRQLAASLGMTYSACNILIFLHILPAVYLLLSVLVGISGFFKESMWRTIINVFIGYLGSIYSLELLFYNLSEYSLDRASFDKSVTMLNNLAEYYNCSYCEINIILFMVLPILIFIVAVYLILSNNRKRGQK